MKSKFKQIAVLLITISFLYLVFVNINFQELINTIKNFNIKYIFLLVISIVISLTFRGYSFKQIISKTATVSLKELSLLCMTGAALNIMLPARAGDIFRAYYVGEKYGADKVKIFGAVMFERIFDGIAIILMLLFALLVYNNNDIARKICFISSLLFLGCFIAVMFAYKYNRIKSVYKFIQKRISFLPNKIKKVIKKIFRLLVNICVSFFNGFEIIQYPKKIIVIIMSTLGIWFFECLNYYIVIQGFGCDVHWSVVLYIVGFIALSSMIPSTSIFIGPYQFAVITAFTLYNINKENALAISFVEQTIVALLVSFIAFLFLFKQNISLGKFKQDIIKNSKIKY